MAAASVALVGCGGHGEQARSARSSGRPAARAPTAKHAEGPRRGQFLRTADALCSRARRRLAPIARAVVAKVADEDAAGVATELRKARPIADRLLEGLRALTPPRAGEDIFHAYLRIVARQEARIQPLAEALEGEDISTIEVLAADLRRDNERAERLARRYGFKRCGPGGLATR
jgi:hypothetical protein